MYSVITDYLVIYRLQLDARAAKPDIPTDTVGVLVPSHASKAGVQTHFRPGWYKTARSWRKAASLGSTAGSNRLISDPQSSRRQPRGLCP
ncbi:MAG: hypothetical protein JWO59_1899 [Chloroflexi bacterium]|nr:hypothetical protein [Chloroflexota bacterium]